MSGHVPFWQIALTYVDSAGDIHGAPIGYMDDTAGVNIANYTIGDEITIGPDTWVIFPVERRFITGGDTGLSGFLGVAYRQVA